jgi:cation-transporting ATPase 13A1
MKNHKRHIVFGGTRILHSDGGNRLQTPKGSCAALVLKTGFETTQGKLIRTILFTTERVTANNKEALMFILILLMFAVGASAYVLYHGLMDQKRSLFKLILNCILIITSVVPPELPMELSLAVNNSLLTLSQLGIWCTEPFRIPMAGKVDICCFDKTGTLTSDKMILSEILSEDDKKWPRLVLGGCHSLINIDGQTVGDPMELAGFIGAQFTLQKDHNIVNNNTKRKIRITKRYPFSSELKRMSTIVSTDKDYMVCVKGAPEVIKGLLTKLPPNYDRYKELMKGGSRVIALAYKTLGNDQVDRSGVESDLIFAGFATFASDIKEDTFTTIQNLLASSHKCTMITGDNVLTGAHVAKELNFIDKNILVLTLSKGVKWLSSDDEEYSVEKTAELCKTHSLCVSGDALEAIMASDANWLKTWIGEIRIFARVSPDQKELILTTLKSLGHATLMCGDGTNDVGALKQADIGVALIDGVDEKEWEKIKTDAKLDKKKPTPPNLTDMLDDNNVVRLGDASIASPFTSKKSTILSTSHIIRQGRCALVTTIQMYKILAINSLISAYSLSVLYFEGVKFGDQQMMISGMFIAAAFLFISRSKPLDTLSAQRPETSIFSPIVLSSILIQFVTNMSALIYLSQSIKALHPQGFDPDGVFVATPFNTVIFLVTNIQTLFTFVNNYEGHPFMQSIPENRGLLITLSALAAMLFGLVLEITPVQYTELFQLVSLGDFRNTLLYVLGANIVINYISSVIIRYIAKIRQ